MVVFPPIVSSVAAAAAAAVLLSSAPDSVSASPLYFAGLEMPSHVNLGRRAPAKQTVVKKADTSIPLYKMKQTGVPSTEDLSAPPKQKKRAGVCKKKATTSTSSASSAAAKTTSTQAKAATSTAKTTSSSSAKATSSTTKGTTSTTSSTAKTTASSAKVTSSTAKTTSTTVKSTTSTAKTTSTTAKATSSTAKATSSTAKATTSTAKTTSSTAKATSSTAKTTSSTATVVTSTAKAIASTTTAKTSSTSSASSSSTTSTSTAASYAMVDTFQGSSFFSGWNFWAYTDPTHGTVAYQNRSSAISSGLAYVNSAGQAVIKVDNTNDYANGTGRPSVRLHSKKAYATGLTMFDVEHMPVGCGVWPALWQNGDNWPNGGEIDVLEGVGDSNINTISLHTSNGCTVDKSSASNNFTGTLLRSNCYAYNSPTGGCSITDTLNSTARPSYGSGFNANKGGIYVVQFEEEGVKIWLLHRDSIPSDVLAGNPNPDSPEWPLPSAIFSTDSCEYDKYFGDQTVIINTTLCGDWGAGTYGMKYTSQASCPGTCNERVMKGANFADAYWVINSVKIYQRG